MKRKINSIAIIALLWALAPARIGAAAPAYRVDEAGFLLSGDGGRAELTQAQAAAACASAGMALPSARAIARDLASLGSLGLINDSDVPPGHGPGDPSYEFVGAKERDGRVDRFWFSAKGYAMPDYVAEALYGSANPERHEEDGSPRYWSASATAYLPFQQYFSFSGSGAVTVSVESEQLRARCVTPDGKFLVPPARQKPASLCFFPNSKNHKLQFLAKVRAALGQNPDMNELCDLKDPAFTKMRPLQLLAYAMMHSEELMQDGQESLQLAEEIKNQVLAFSGELLRRGANPNGLGELQTRRVSTFALSALDSAVLSGSLELVDLYLRHGANPNLAANPQLPLQTALTYALSPVVQVRPHSGQRPNSPLVEIASLLVKNGHANANIQDEKGDTLLLRCLDRNLVDGADILSPLFTGACVALMDLGADVSLPNKAGTTPLCNLGRQTLDEGRSSILTDFKVNYDALKAKSARPGACEVDFSVVERKLNQ